MKALAAIAAAAVLTGCTVTPQGKSIDRANYADMASTAVALVADSSAVEANPLGLALIPIKMAAGYVVEWKYEDDCYKRAQAAGVLNSFYYGATVNNLAVAASVSGPAWPIVLGIAAGITYHVYRDQLEPGVYECVPAEMQEFATAYAAGDLDGVVEAFTVDGVDGDNVGHAEIRAAYAALFASSTERRLLFTDSTTVVADVDGRYHHYQYTVEIVDGKIAALNYNQGDEE